MDLTSGLLWGTPRGQYSRAGVPAIGLKTTQRARNPGPGLSKGTLGGISFFAMRRGIGSSAVAVAVAAAAVLTAAAAGAATPPGNFKRHENRHWTWYAPKGWGAAFGANDIYISSPTGTLFLHYGAGGVPCSYPPYWTTINGYFSLVRDSYLQNTKRSFDFYSHPLRTARYTNVGPTRQIRNGYFRQVSRFRGRRPSGRQIKGEMVLDLFAVDPLSNVCGERQQVRSAPANGIRGSLRLLRIVQSVIFGPRQ
jgi:hypothetical protein